MGPLTGNVFQYNKSVSKMKIFVCIAHAQKPHLNASVDVSSRARGVNIFLGKGRN